MCRTKLPNLWLAGHQNESLSLILCTQNKILLGWLKTNIDDRWFNAYIYGENKNIGYWALFVRFGWAYRSRKGIYCLLLVYGAAIHLVVEMPLVWAGQMKGGVINSICRYCMGSIAKCCMSAHWVGFPLNAKSFARPNSNHFCPTSLMLSLWRLFMYGEKSEKWNQTRFFVSFFSLETFFLFLLYGIKGNQFCHTILQQIFLLSSHSSSFFLWAQLNYDQNMFFI